MTESGTFTHTPIEHEILQTWGEHFTLLLLSCHKYPVTCWGLGPIKLILDRDNLKY